MEKIHYPLGDKLPEISKLIEVAQGVFWLRMSLPFALDHINLWLLRDCIEGKEGWTIIDCGINNPETKLAWESIFQNELMGLPVIRVLATHMHPDHIGLAHWLCEKWQLPLWISMTDYLMARWLSGPEGGTQVASVAGGVGMADHYQRHGLANDEDLEKIRSRHDYYTRLVPNVPSQYRRLMDGDMIEIGNRQWKLISGYGHSPEHIALSCVDDSLLISGDMVLPKISTNISVYGAEPDADPLKLFLNSINKFLPLDEQTLVLPSHGKPFQGLHYRINELHLHHQARLAETMEACREPQTAFQIVPILFLRKLDNHQLSFALGEAIAHLNFLWHSGKLKRQMGSDGILRFSQ